ncbi:MAG TPA: LLM class F420-dependent oxidoreductase [Acidimicrobiales bacterium]|nr:LLM class F420-dependent oxidoreductase [Acidimicrobiales bacterium]
MRLGYQMPDFTFPDVAPEGLFPRLQEVARAAEGGGFDTVMVMDHFYQLPLLGPPEHEMLEAYTLLGALAASTERARLGTLVTGVTYRNPALLAKVVSTLDVISGGRAMLGIGAAWFDVEHRALGFDFPPVKERMERLEEALGICTAMFRGERPTIEGRHYRVEDAINSPAPLQGGAVPVMVGGQGERRTLRLAAQYADILNLTSGWDELPHKVEVLQGHAADVGRDPGEVAVTMLVSACVGETEAEAEARRDDLLARRGLDWSSLDDATRALVEARFLVGGPEGLADRLGKAREQGLDGIAVNLPGDGHDPDRVGRAGELLSAALA